MPNMLKPGTTNPNNRFNPYTEPSMEIFSYHEGLKKLIEVRTRPLQCTSDGLDANRGYTNYRLATVACSDRKCWKPWACPRT